MAKKPTITKMVSIRVAPGLWEATSQAATARGLTVTAFVHLALAAALDRDTP